MPLSEYFIFSLFILLGILSVVAGLFDLDWYFRTRGAMLFIKWIGRSGARLFYALLGLALIACGIAGINQ